MLKINLNMDLSGLKKSLNDDKLGYFMSTTVHKHYTPSMPYNTGNFSKIIKFDAWEYTHLVPYAKETYLVNKNYRKDKHPDAMSRYIEGYSVIAMPKIEKDIAAYITKRSK